MHSGRLPLHDYRSATWYFITVCTNRRVKCVGRVENERVELTRLGEMAVEEWCATLKLRPLLQRDAFVIMPNHVHLLFGLESSIGPADLLPPIVGSLRTFSSPQKNSVGSVVGGYKSAVARKARQNGLWSVGPLWQSRFYDRVVRDEDEYHRIRQYILENPRLWGEDRLAS